MAKFSRSPGRWTVALSLAASLLVSSMPVSFAGPGDTNSTNTESNVVGGTYFNTADSRTTFANANGLTVGAGTTVRGLEVDGVGATTGNGGRLHFDAGNGVMRVNGTIDASAVLEGGSFKGNGGTVTINAGALEQNGNIFVMGQNGGSLMTNVGSLTMGPNARIDASGVGVNGMAGQINMNATGKVTIPNGAVLDASGNYIGGYNANVIQVSGSIVNLDGVVMANGLSAGAKGGTIGIYGTEIALGSNAKVTANGGAGGEGGNVLVGGTRNEFGYAVQDNKGLAVASANKVTNDGLISANGGNGQSGVDGGKGGIVTVVAKNEAVNNGVISSNGGQGFNGYNPSNGGAGGDVEFGGYYANRVDNNGQLQAIGGNGGTNPYDSVGKVVYGQQVSVGQDGGNGGYGGSVVVAFNANMTNPGLISVAGGNGGLGQAARAEANGAHQIARGGNGGNGGNGGWVEFQGVPDQNVLANVKVNGGHGAQGGAANIKSDCGCATPGAKGTCGNPGSIVVNPRPPICTGGNCSPPPKPPGTPPLFPLYPKEYSSLGDTLPRNAGNVLSYNRSIFLARSPMPIIQKRVPAPPPPAPAKIMVVKPKPKPPQKKVPVRGYW